MSRESTGSREAKRARESLESRESSASGESRESKESKEDRASRKSCESRKSREPTEVKRIQKVQGVSGVQGAHGVQGVGVVVVMVPVTVLVVAPFIHLKSALVDILTQTPKYFRTPAKAETRHIFSLLGLPRSAVGAPAWDAPKIRKHVANIFLYSSRPRVRRCLFCNWALVNIRTRAPAQGSHKEVIVVVREVYAHPGTNRESADA